MSTPISNQLKKYMCIWISRAKGISQKINPIKLVLKFVDLSEIYFTFIQVLRISLWLDNICQIKIKNTTVSKSKKISELNKALE